MSKAKPKEINLMLEILRAWNSATEEARQEALTYLRTAVEGKQH